MLMQTFGARIFEKNYKTVTKLLQNYYKTDTYSVSDVRYEGHISVY